jgi:hypothetical protein
MPIRNQCEALSRNRLQGQATTFLIEHDSVETIYCIDTWEGSIEHEAGGIADNKGSKVDMSAVEARFDQNVIRACRKKKNETGLETTVHKLKGSSRHHLSGLNTLPEFQEYFDFIYVDGDHSAKGVLADAVMAWPLLKRPGFMIFDDYLWSEIYGLHPLTAPKLGIDSFINTFKDEIKICELIPLYQLVVAKVDKWAYEIP